MNTDTTNNVDKTAFAEAIAASVDADAKIHDENGMRRYKQRLPVKLTDADLAANARKTGELRRAHRELKAQLKEAKDHIKGKIDGIVAELDDLGKKAEPGEEHRDVDCIEEREYRTGTLSVTRLDTGAIVETRALRGSERQASLFDHSPKDDEPTDDCDINAQEMPADVVGEPEVKGKKKKS